MGLNDFDSFSAQSNDDGRRALIQNFPTGPTYFTRVYGHLDFKRSFAVRFYLSRNLILFMTESKQRKAGAGSLKVWKCL